MSFTVVIPARYASSRLPGKPLAEIAGKPMIQHVCERAAESRADRVVVATDDDRIRTACEGFGAEVVMTSPNHASGTDRLEEVARAPIPWARDQWQGGTPLTGVDGSLPDNIGYFRHIGIYGYRASVLGEFVSWAPAPTEVTESLEQLRALYNGARIHVDVAAVNPPGGIDTEADLQRVRNWLERRDIDNG